MKRIICFARNLIILELVIFVPGMIAIFGHMPDRLDVTIVADSAVSMSLGFAEKGDDSAEETIVQEQSAGCLGNDQSNNVSFYFADSFDVTKARLRYSCAGKQPTIKDMTLVRNLFIREKVDLINHTTSFCGFELPDLPGVVILFYSFHIGLALLALLGVFFRTKMSSRALWINASILALVGSMFLAIVLPCQTIFSNRDVFDYPIGTIVSQLSLNFIILFVCLLVILRLSAVVLGGVPHILFAAFLVYEYLQTGILSAGNPSLNGSLIHYMEMAPALYDMAWIVGVFGVFVIIARRIQNVFHWIVIALGLLMIASMFDAGSSAKAIANKEGKEADNPWQFKQLDVVKSLRFSPIRNIIVLGLDSSQSDAAYDVIMKDSNLRDVFEGFCAYNNNIGMHSFTELGVPGILTGEWCQNPQGGESFATCYKHFCAWSKMNSFANVYLEQDLPVFISPGLSGEAFSNRVRIKASPRRKFITSNSIFRQRKASAMGLSLLDCYRFRLVPFVLKIWSLRVSNLGLSVDDGTREERTLYPSIIANDLSGEEKTALIFLMTHGAHPPVHYDANGNRIYKDKDSYVAYCGQMHFVLKCVGGLLRGLKEKGIYDNSMIIITADHGNDFDTPQWPGWEHVPPRAIPMLWVKPFGAKGVFYESQLPTSHCKIAPLIKSASDRNLTREAIDAILKTEIRYYRHGFDYSDHFENYYFDESGRSIDAN